MICSKCKQAGKLNDAKYTGHSIHASQLHAECEWPMSGGCACQHKLGNYLQSNTDRPMERLK